MIAVPEGVELGFEARGSAAGLEDDGSFLRRLARHGGDVEHRLVVARQQAERDERLGEAGGDDDPALSVGHPEFGRLGPGDDDPALSRPVIPSSVGLGPGGIDFGSTGNPTAVGGRP